MPQHDLEYPGTAEVPDWASLYRATLNDVQESRPVFTGDVFTDVAVLGDPKVRISALLLQHPCALRANGVDLVPRLLVAEVRAGDLIPPNKWNGNYKVMPLPELGGEGRHYQAHLREPYLVQPDALRSATRIACMSQIGVNLLLQRWVHHNSRVVVPTFEYQRTTAAQFEEADLVEDWCVDLAEEPSEIADETAAAHAWLRENSSTPGKRWQDLLEDEQTRSTVRIAMRKHIKELSKARR